MVPELEIDNIRPTPRFSFRIDVPKQYSKEFNDTSHFLMELISEILVNSKKRIPNSRSVNNSVKSSMILSNFLMKLISPF